MGRQVEYFETENNEKIAIDAKLREFHQKTLEKHGSPLTLKRTIEAASVQLAGSFDNVSKSANEELTDRRNTMSKWGYASRFMQAAVCLHHLEQAGIKPKFRKMLDVGTGFGAHPRIMKAIGVVTEKAVGVDIVERGTTISDSVLRAQHRKMRQFRWIDWYLERLEAKDEDKLAPYEMALLKSCPSPRLRLHRGQGLRLPRDVYTKYPMKHAPSLDEYLVKDVYDIEGRYDLITIFSSVGWFDAKKLIAKVETLLEPGGIFYMYAPSWWAGNNCCWIAGHFPFTRQSVTRADYERYIREYYPEEEQEARLMAYDYFDKQHPTVSDYVSFGLEAGLAPIRVDRGIATENYAVRYGMQSRGYATDAFADFRAAHDRIKKIRPDVGAEDMMSNIVTIVFQKPKDQNATTADIDFDRLASNLAKSYQSQSLIWKTVRSLGLNFIKT